MVDRAFPSYVPFFTPRLKVKYFQAKTNVHPAGGYRKYLRLR